jgi:NADH:ubiquinone oxidoreductase subunit 5 (subunit L)/multisubunit Na+/H+ antiporter MnhA subunit
MGVLVVLYARYYMSPQDPVPRFFCFLMAFMGAMLGTVLSGNLIQLVIFWELTSLTSFMLIAYWYHRADARRGARMALIVTATGGMCLLLGLVWLGSIAGGFDLDTVLASGDKIRAYEHYPVVARRFPFTSGCPMRWRHPRRYRRTYTPRRWSKPACSFWHASGLRSLARPNGSGSCAHSG